ncbi:MAG: hypothetical protein AAGA62_17560 [Bacteroidota bacterium]
MKTLPYFSTIFLILLLAASELSAQNGLPVVAGNRGLALGGAGVTFNDAYAVWTNPAGLGDMDRLGVNVSGEQRFGISELQLVSLGAAIPTDFGGIGVSISSFGFSTLRESRVGLSYGRRLAPNFRIGVGLLGFNTAIEGYDSRFAATFSIGFQVDILPELSVGFRAFSPLRVETVEGEYLPQLLSAGFSYNPNEKVTVLAEVHQDLDVTARFRGGIEYSLSQELDLRFGVASGPAEVSFGAGYFASENIRIEVAANYHETLGLSPGVGLVFRGE